MKRNLGTLIVWCAVGAGLLPLGGCTGDLLGGLTDLISQAASDATNTLTGNTAKSLDGTWDLWLKEQATASGNGTSTDGSDGTSDGWISGQVAFVISNGQATEYTYSNVANDLGASAVLIDGQSHTAPGGEYVATSSLSLSGTAVQMTLSLDTTLQSTDATNTVDQDWTMTGTFDATDTITGTLEIVTVIDGNSQSGSSEFKLVRR